MLRFQDIAYKEINKLNLMFNELLYSRYTTEHYKSRIKRERE